VKTFILPLGGLFVAVVSAGLPSPGLAQDFSDNNPELIRLCKEAVGRDGRREDVGRCVSFYSVDDDALDTHVCVQWQRSGFLTELGFKSVGECMKSGLAAP
jgi:hypothetical protein